MWSHRIGGYSCSKDTQEERREAWLSKPIEEYSTSSARRLCGEEGRAVASRRSCRRLEGIVATSSPVFRFEADRPRIKSDRRAFAFTHVLSRRPRLISVK